MKQTALHTKHLALNAKMVPFAGFDMPVQYSSVIEEHRAVRESVGLFDVSHMGQFFVRGPKAEALVQKVTTNDITKTVVGQAQYSCMTRSNGGIVDDLISYRLSDTEFLLVVNAANIEKDWEWISSQNTMNAEMENASDAYSLLAIQGPKAVEAMQSLAKTNLGEIPFYHFVQDHFAGYSGVIISATGYTGSGGFEIYCKNQDAGAIWDAVLDAGKSFGIQACGLAARDTLRLEKGYNLYGNDITDETTPLEAGLGWVTKLNTDFVGRDALATQKENGLTRKLVAFVMEERGIPRKDYAILDAEGKTIGGVTSGTQSPLLQQGIGLGYVALEQAKVGNEIFVAVRNKSLGARVVKLPFV